MDLTPWICIARTGTFQDASGRTHTFSESDLEAIRAGYDPKKTEAPLVFGHPKDSDPAYGWVHALKRQGAKLFAQFAHVPAEVKNLVQTRRYRNVSMSLSHDKRRLLHVGLLGAAAPAIDGLGPVELNADGITFNFAVSPEQEEATTPGGNMAATAEELQRQIGELTAQVKALEKENGELKAKLETSDKDKGEAEKGKKDAEEKASKAAADFAAFQDGIANEKRAARVRALVDSGKLPPAKEQDAISFAAALAKVAEPVNFSAPDGNPQYPLNDKRRKNPSSPSVSPHRFTGKSA